MHGGWSLSLRPLFELWPGWDCRIHASSQQLHHHCPNTHGNERKRQWLIKPQNFFALCRIVVELWTCGGQTVVRLRPRHPCSFSLADVCANQERQFKIKKRATQSWDNLSTTCDNNSTSCKTQNSLSLWQLKYHGTSRQTFSVLTFSYFSTIFASWTYSGQGLGWEYRSSRIS